MKIGLSLAGGGIKGAAHIGVLKALEEKNIKIDMISGASSGSLIATLYAARYTINEIYTFFQKYAKDIKYVDFSNILKLIMGLILGKGVTIMGLTKGKMLEKHIYEKCKEKQIVKIKDVKFPIYISCIDACNGDTYIFTNSNCRIGSDIELINDIKMSTAVRASCSYPGVFEPVNWKGHKLIDGGIKENIPWKVLKYAGADKVISVVFKDITKKECCKNMINVIDCSLGYLSSELQKYEICGSDIIIEIPTNSVGLLDYSKVKELFNLGYKIAIEKLEYIKL